VTELPKGDLALGLSGDAEYTDRKLVLSRGQTLLAYSDGLTEAQSEAGEFFGPERLTALCTRFAGVSAQTFGERILAEVTRFEGQARRNDDLSLVILQKSA